MIAIKSVEQAEWMLQELQDLDRLDRYESVNDPTNDFGEHGPERTRIFQRKMEIMESVAEFFGLKKHEWLGLETRYFIGRIAKAGMGNP